MNCAEYEQGLARVMAGEQTAGEGARDLERLRAHGQDCGECGGSSDLLDWLELPPSEREIVAAPGPEYWAGFNDRLGRRLDAPGRRSRSGLWWWVTATAATLLLLIAGPGLLRQIRSAPSPEKVSNRPGGTPEASETLDAPEMPDELAGMLASASPDELGLALPWASSSPQDDEPVLGEPIDRPGGLLPDAAGLDDEARRELLQWLREQARGVSS